MEKELSDLHALQKLYGLLQRLDETSRALLKKLLGDATRQALMKQAKALTPTSDSVIPFSLGLASPKEMDQATSSSSSFLNNKEVEMEQILSDLQALTRLYTLLHKGPTDENLDEVSRALLMKILEDATQEAVRRQAMILASERSPQLNLQHSTVSSRSGLHVDGHRHTSEEPPLARLASKHSSRTALPRPSLLASERSRQLNLQHSTVPSRSGRHVDDHRHASEEPPLARLASKRSSRTALPRPSLLASERSRQLNLQHSTVSSRSGLHVDDHRHASKEPPLARLASKRSSRTALPAQHRPSQEQRHSSLSFHSLPVSGTSQHVTVTRGTRLANRRDSIRHSSSRGDQWSLERSISSSRSVSRESSLGPSSRMHDRATSRHVGTESSSSVPPFERLGSGLSVSTTSRHGVEHAGRGVAMSERYSSSNTVATIHSRIRPSNSLHAEPSPRRSAEEGRTARQRHVSDVSSADMYSTSMSSGSRSSSAAASLYASTSPTTSPAPASPRAFAKPYYYSPPVMAPRGIAPPPVYAPEVSRSMRRRRRQEVLEKRVARLRMLKDKIATVFHHRVDHHHHHHLGSGQEAGPSSRSVVRSAGRLSSPWQHLITSMFHSVKGKVKNTRSRTVVGVPEKMRGGGGGGNMHALFDAVRLHLKSKRKAPAAGIKLRMKGSRARAKKMHWWQQLTRRRGVAGLTAGSRPRRR